MRAAIAVRVSPRPAENVRYSPELQETKCRDWCAAGGHEVVTVIRDILVSGGSADRFDSIFAALDSQPVDIMVVSDLSRWTRDRPSRFWAIRAILEDRGVRLVSVDEPWITSDAPFTDTVTTAKVEANYLQRVESNRKTSLGVRKAWASGKRWGRPFGWTFDRRTREWSVDEARVKALYADWLSGVSAYEIASRHGLGRANVRPHIRARCQRDVVGADVWDAAQARLRPRAGRRDAKRPSIYAGMLACPFCGRSMAHSPRRWMGYVCPEPRLMPHDWSYLSAAKWVHPKVREALSTLVVPDDDLALLAPEAPLPPPARDWQGELDRLTMAWVKGRLSDDRYERAVADVEASRTAVVYVPPPEEQVEMVRNLSVIDLDDRDVATGQAANAVLREMLTITLTPSRDATVAVRPQYAHWVRHPSAP